jgi:CheY-like chemotaxis protein
MARTGPIVIVDDDKDDQEIMEEALKEMNVENGRIYFLDCQRAFDYLKTTRDSPIIILCDINIPGLNGLEFKRRIDDDQQLRSKSIPFVFFSTAVDKHSINTAYKEMTVQGFFKKQNTMMELKKTLGLIINYWRECRHPNMNE